MTTGECDSIALAMAIPDMIPNDIETLRTALAAEQLARREAGGTCLRCRSHGGASEAGDRTVEARPVCCVIRTWPQAARPDGAATRGVGGGGSRGCVRHSQGHRGRGILVADRHARHCRNICRGNAWLFPVLRRVRVVAAGWPSLARRSPRRSKSSHASGRWCRRCARSSPAAPARPSRSHQPHSIPSRAAERDRTCWP